MAYFIENFGLDYSKETSELLNDIALLSVKKGKELPGYSGNSYYSRKYGDFEMILRTELDEDEHKLMIKDYDTHCPGNAVWNVCVSGIDIDYKDDSMRKRIVIKSREDGKGMCVVDVMNSDILPSYLEGDEISLQVIAFPIEIDYLETEEEYDATLPRDKFGQAFGLADGGIFPIGMFSKGSPDENGEEPEDEVRSHVMIRGRVKCFKECYVQFGESRWELVRTLIDTQFGELEIVHTYDQVKQEQRKNLRKDAIIAGIFEISGDPAINSYSDGLVKNEENNLRALRQVFVKGDSERLNAILADDAVYITAAGKTYSGKEAIIQRLRYVHECQQEDNTEVHTWMATLQQSRTGEQMPYDEGKRCVIISYKESCEPQAIAFLEMNEEARIVKLVVSDDFRYAFRIDKPLGEATFSEEIKVPDSFVRPMLLRAMLHGVISTEEVDAMEAEVITPSDKDITVSLYSAVKENGFDDERYEYMFGYLFAKAAEARVSPGAHIGYYPEDVLERRFTSDLSDDWNSRIQTSMELGRRFYKDFRTFHPVDDPEDTTYEEDMNRALILLKMLGAKFDMESLPD